MGGLIGAGLCTAAGLLLSEVVWLDQRISHLSYDFLFSLKPQTVLPDEAVIVSMDEYSHRELAQPYEAPWDRSLHAHLLDNLKKAGTRTVVFDVLFSDYLTNNLPTQELQDQALARTKRMADAMADHGRVVLGVEKTFIDDQAGAGFMYTTAVEPLFDAAFTNGVLGVTGDYDLMVRRHNHGDPHKDLLPSISWAAAAACDSPFTRRAEDLDRERWINYYGPPATLPNFSYWVVVRGDPQVLEKLKGKVVFVGSRVKTFYSGQHKDEFPTPYSYWKSDIGKFMHGVEVQATIFLNLLRGDWLSRLSPNLELALVVLSGLMVGFGLAQMRPLAAFGLALVAVAALILFVYLCFVVGNLWFAWLILLIQTFIGASWAITYNSVSLLFEKKLLAQSLSAYVSPARVKQLMQQPELLKPGAEKHEVSILFSDIADFTKISEGMDSDELARMMNEYFEQAISRIHEADGTVIKLIGDAIFAVWNAPVEQANHRELACKGALWLRDHVAVSVSGPEGKPLVTRIGLHTGVANVGNFGSSTRFDYTALGESINLASRMEGLNKHLGTTILVTAETHQAVENKIVSRYVGKFRLKGFERAVEAYELIGQFDTAEATRRWREAFAAALKDYRDCDLKAAEAGFRKTLALKPDDGPSQFYLNKLMLVNAASLDSGWTGETELKEK